MGVIRRLPVGLFHPCSLAMTAEQCDCLGPSLSQDVRNLAADRQWSFRPPSPARRVRGSRSGRWRLRSRPSTRTPGFPPGGASAVPLAGGIRRRPDQTPGQRSMPGRRPTRALPSHEGGSVAGLPARPDLAPDDHRRGRGSLELRWRGAEADDLCGSMSMTATSRTSRLRWPVGQSSRAPAAGGGVWGAGRVRVRR